MYICPEHLDWFESVLCRYPASEGWRVIVATHAPPMGSGLRVLQGLHVKNGCAWLNHAEPAPLRRRFLELVRAHPCIKAWFSGHFHLGQDYQDSISVPAPVEISSSLSAAEAEIEARKQCSCVFVQTGVMGGSSARDGRRQSRILKGNKDGLEIYTVSHHKGGELRLDATVSILES